MTMKVKESELVDRIVTPLSQRLTCGDVVCLGVGASAGCVGSSENDLACSCFVITWFIAVVAYHDD